MDEAMTRPDGEDAQAPSPEQLAAYADGELDAGPLAPLKPRVQETTTLLSMLPDQPRSGPVNVRWRVVENDGYIARRKDRNETELPLA